MNTSTAESVFLGVAGGTMLLCGLSRLRAAVLRPTAVRVGLSASLLTYSIALLINVGPVARLLDHSLFDRHELTILLSQVLTTVTAWVGVEMVVASAHRATRRGLRVRLALTLVACAWQCATFFAPRSSAPELPVVEFYLQTRVASEWQLYWVSYGVISGAGSVVLGVSSARYARYAAPWLRRGLRWVTLGSILCTLFSASIVVSTFTSLPAIGGLLQVIVVATGATMIGIGCVVPQLPDLRARHQLMPMWRVVTDIYPDVRIGGRHPDLPRAVTEIQDAVLMARDRDEIASPLMRELVRLPIRPAGEYELAVADLCRLARRNLSPWWDENESHEQSLLRRTR